MGKLIIIILIELEDLKMANEEETKKDLDEMCSKYAIEIENLSGDEDIEEFFDDVLDIRYIVDGTKNYIGAELCVACGGPAVWINTIDQQVKGYWGDTRAEKHFRDASLDDYVCELWENLK